VKQASKDQFGLKIKLPNGNVASRVLLVRIHDLGEMDKALYWLENTVNCGFINYPFMAEIDPFLENIRGEERFKKLLERVKYEWENFEV
jgi:hypothetical protein